MIRGSVVRNLEETLRRRVIPLQNENGPKFHRLRLHGKGAKNDLEKPSLLLNVMASTLYKFENRVISLQAVIMLPF